MYPSSKGLVHQLRPVTSLSSPTTYRKIWTESFGHGVREKVGGTRTCTYWDCWIDVHFGGPKIYTEPPFERGEVEGRGLLTSDTVIYV